MKPLFLYWVVKVDHQAAVCGVQIGPISDNYGRENACLIEESMVTFKITREWAL